MKTFATWVVLGIGIFQMTAYAGGSSSAGSGERFSVVGSNNQFGNTLVKQVAQDALAKNANQNIFLSPLSAAMALQMLLNGAGTQSSTYAQIAQALALNGAAIDVVNSSNKALLAQLQSESNQTPTAPDGTPLTPFILNIANSIWGNTARSFTFNPNFASTLSSAYQAQALTADFSTQAAVDAINQWASQKTAGKITNIVDLPTLSQLDFSLMNATYFKANWENQFDPSETTHAQSFVQGDGSSTAVEMMNALLYGYTETSDAQIMELPYTGGTASMFVALPKAGHTLSDLIEDAKGPLSEGFWAARSQVPAQSAHFSMPKIKMSYQADLISSLKALGITDVFSSNADLSLLGGVGERIGLVQQNSFLNVDEAGTEAAAVTIIGGAGSAAPNPNTPVMIVNHPFLLSIVDHASGSVLFEGTISSQK